MTKQECKDKMILLWDHLEEYPEQGKTETYRALGLEPDLSDCPCCEYVKQKLDGMASCYYCPMGFFWPFNSFVPCTHPLSVYRDWQNGSISEKRIAAGKIAQASRRIEI